MKLTSLVEVRLGDSRCAHKLNLDRVDRELESNTVASSRHKHSYITAESTKSKMKIKQSNGDDVGTSTMSKPYHGENKKMSLKVKAMMNLTRTGTKEPVSNRKENIVILVTRVNVWKMSLPN